jgi:hypothetical protein
MFRILLFRRGLNLKMKHIFKVVAVFAIGFGVGAISANLVLAKRYEALVQEEIDSIKMTRGRSEDTNVDRKPEESLSSQVKKLTLIKDRYKNIADQYSDPAQPCDDPHVIDIQEFSEGMTSYDKTTLFYYVGDDTLIDEDEEIVEDRVAIVGENYRSYLVGADDPQDNEVVYVRNERLTSDYEIICFSGRYEQILTGDGEE